MLWLMRARLTSLIFKVNFIEENLFPKKLPKTNFHLPKTRLLKNTMLRGKPFHPQKGNFPHPLFPLKSRKKWYDKIRILFYDFTVLLRFYLCFLKKQKTPRFQKISRSDFYFCIIDFYLFKATWMCPKTYALFPLGKVFLILNKFV